MSNKVLKINIDNLFEKDLKKLLKRFRTLESDLNMFIKSALRTHFEQDVPTRAFVPIEGCCNNKYVIYKVRKFASKSLKNFGNRTGFRIIFAYDKDNLQVNFLEIYYKGDQEKESRDRIIKFLNRGTNTK